MQLQFVMPKISSDHTSAFWFANTDKVSFDKVPRPPGDTSPFRYWRDDGRLYVTPDREQPFVKYHAALTRIQPGDYVFAYEKLVGFVGVGRVNSPKDLRTERGAVRPDGTFLYPDPEEVVRSIAVTWDDTIRRPLHTIEGTVLVHPLCEITSTQTIYADAMALYRAHEQRHVDTNLPDEALLLERLRGDTRYDSKTREQIVLARMGQGAFRGAVLLREPVCRVTGVHVQDHLVASHIKPWAACDGQEHLDGNNGLMLAPHIDHLFDGGHISFEDNGDLLLAPGLDRLVLQSWHMPEVANVGAFSAAQAHYLAYHRQRVFGRRPSRASSNVAGERPGTDAHHAGQRFDGPGGSAPS